jgi:pimeloyl-ACP methyl ester carboxylesterase
MANLTSRHLFQSALRFSPFATFIVEGVVVKGSGHWLMEEAPDQVIPRLVEFLEK